MSLLYVASMIKNTGPTKGGGEGEQEVDANRRAAMARKTAVESGRRGGGGGGEYSDLKVRIQNKLLAELDPSLDINRKDEIRRQIQELFNAILAEENMVLSKAERLRLFEAITADIIGFGPLEILLAQENITEIMVNGPKDIFIEAKGQLTPRQCHLRQRRPCVADY